LAKLALKAKALCDLETRDDSLDSVCLIACGLACPSESPRDDNRIPLLAAVRKESEGLPTPADQSESVQTVFYRDDFVLLTDDSKCRLARIDDISILEAFRNATFVHFAEDKFLIRRSLVEIERRLDSSMFFRASRDCIVNLSQVMQPRLLQNGGLVFLLRDGKEVLFSRRQSTLFRKIGGL
jgi:DNA-binding LytR/AlgR family response regulator